MTHKCLMLSIIKTFALHKIKKNYFPFKTSVFKEVVFLLD